MGCENLGMHGSQLLLWAASQFFFQNVDLYKSLLGCENYHCACGAPDRNYDISCFPIGPKANWDRVCILRGSLSRTGSKLVPEVSPRPELHCEALHKIFRPPSAEP